MIRIVIVRHGLGNPVRGDFHSEIEAYRFIAENVKWLDVVTVIRYSLA
jgi:hypothetical protein